ncbi:MAG: flagellar basal body P-ring protein FlgI [Candidatus Margulisiibacteriota bacterium]
MNRVKKIFAVLLAVSFGTAVFAASPPVRLKDIARVLEARENQLMGFGLVVGLRNTGDRSQNEVTQQAMANVLSRMGIIPQAVDFKTRNTAAVMVTAALPPFVKPGDKIDITVSSVGDATSLQGGTLLTTPLQGVDDQIYAVGQGNVVVGAESFPYVKQQTTTVGRIPGGALVEKEVPVTAGKSGSVTLVLTQPDFTSANRVVAALSRVGLNAEAKDAATIVVSSDKGEDYVALISKIEAVRVTPDTVAKIIINERTGTIVIGENVVIAPVAVSYGGIEVTIRDVALYSEGGASAGDQYQATTRARLNKTGANLKVIPASPTLARLVRALNAINASPKDMIAILQALKKSGAIKAELEII